MKFLSALVIIFFTSINLTSIAFSSNVDKGKELSVSCAACHGDNGISVNPVWPKLAGQTLSI